MMQLFLIRHAESTFEGINDHSRDLSEHGINQATKSAQFIKQNITSGSIKIITSDALRTIKTAQIIQKHISGSELETDSSFYSARAGEWCDAIIENKNHRHLILVGHNPTMGFLSQHLCPNHIKNFSPACVAHYQLEISADGLRLPAQPMDFFDPDATQ